MILQLCQVISLLDCWPAWEVEYWVWGVRTCGIFRLHFLSSPYCVTKLLESQGEWPVDQVYVIPAMSLSPFSLDYFCFL